MSSPLTVPPPVSGLETYAQLKRRVREALNEGDSRAQTAYEREQVRAKWNAGKLIQEHILLNQKRAGYGDQVLKKLSADLNISVTELSYMLQFAQAYTIFPHAEKLSWDKFRDLLTVNEPEQRTELVRKASREKWTREKIRSEIKRVKRVQAGSVKNPSVEKITPPQKGQLYLYQIISDEAGLLKIDLGFSCRRDLSPADAKRFKAGDIVESKAGKDGTYTLNAVRSSLEKLFTYQITIREVIDGDTFWAQVDLGFGFNTKQRLRMRWIDAPEIQTAAGIDSQKALSKLLGIPSSSPRKRGSIDAEPLLLIKSTKDDNYGRYLVDLWAGDTYLNQKLIDKRLAIWVPE